MAKNYIHPHHHFSTLLLIFSSTCLSLTNCQTNNDITFTLMEEQKADTPIGNVAQASGIQGDVTAQDFQNLRYQILSSDGLRISSLFTINSRTGALFTNAMIDREQVCDSTAVNCQLEFDVTVKLEVAVIRILHVVVVIQDINDNAPSFPSPDLHLSISEAAPQGSEISISGAIDRDAGLEADITYWMDDSDVFELREEKLLDVSALKLVLKQGLDRETQSEYQLQIFAKDGNTSSALTGTLSVTITVTDVNDHTPKFTKQMFNFTVKEDAEVDSLVGTLEATDLDSGENGRITFKFSSLTSSRVLTLFKLDTDSGNVTVQSALEYESGEKFQAVVEAKDHGGSPRASQAILVINVIDAGNTPPKLSLILADPLYQDRTLLAEDLPVAWFVGTLKYQDNDDGDNGVVDCTSMNPHFTLKSIEDNGYSIEISTPLDREAQNEMTVILKCSDRGTPSLSSFENFTVLVSDANDNSPVFETSDYTGKVKERVETQANIVQVSATDADEGKNRDLTYQLTMNSSNSFTVDPFTGWISLISPVDREAGPIIHLTVLAVDKGDPPLTGSVTVTIYVEDVNDNAPEITRTEYQVKENEDPGAFVAQVVASDNDDGVNGEMTFSLVSDPSSGFHMSENGVITTAKMFDRESVDHYIIVVSVSDKGTPPMSSTSTLTITIADANDHSPQITFPRPGNDTVTISANLSPGTVIAKANAVDEDLDKNARLLYLIAEGNPHTIFSIDNTTGTIFLSKRPTVSRDNSYRLTISVQDAGNPRLHNNTYLYISIDFTNATLIDDASNMEQKYIIIAGVIAGITVVIAFIVIFIIVKLRRTDPGRCVDSRPKAKGGHVTHPGPTDVPKVSVHGMSNFKVDTDRQGGFGGDKDKGRDPNTSFDSNMTNGTIPSSHKVALTPELLEPHNNGGFSLFPQGRQRLASEDIHSDTSGETTNSDSGRGASDVEDGSSGASPPMPYHTGGVPANTSASRAPQVPPREPVNTNVVLLPGNQGPYTTNPQIPRDSSSMGDLSRAARAYASHKDFDKSRKTPSKVRFSFDDQNIDNPRFNRAQPQNEVRYGNVQPPQGRPGNYPNILSGDRLKPDGTPANGQFPRSRVPSYSTQNERDFPHMQPLRHEAREKLNNLSGPDVPLSRDAIAKHNRVQGQIKQQHLPSNSYPLLHPHYNSHHSHRGPLSSLNHSIDEDDDDGGSTTTSGSYAIDGIDDNLNVSVEC